MQKDAHYVAWHWGGTIGGTIVLLALLAFTVDRALMLGAVTLWAGQIAGFGLLWLGWWLRHRGGSAR